jgi:hypothetical protein
MSSIESSTSGIEAAQKFKDEFRVKFTAKLDDWIASKKQPTIKTDKIYDEIVKAVQKWEKGERFTGDMTKYNYGSR